LASPFVEAGNDGKLIHIHGMVVPEGTLEDPIFQTSANALQLIRQVEMYQWEETSESKTEKKVGGSTETITTYHYSKGWYEGRIDSSDFKKPADHQNPTLIRYDSDRWATSLAKLGDFVLSKQQVAQIGSKELLAINRLPESLQGQAKLTGDGLYFGENPQQPQIGDLRIRFYQVPAQDATLVAQQQQNRLVPYITSNGESLELVKTGLLSAEGMFQAARSDNTIMTWVIRLVGFSLMMIGLTLLLKPLSVFADVIPFLGNLVEMGIGLVSFLIAAPLSLITIAIAWIYYRPVVGIALLLVSVVFMVLIKKKMPKRTLNPVTSS
jgi:hypothetical protein